jgi:hypothetical protein
VPWILDHSQTEEILAVDEILARLTEIESATGRAMELRYFGGLSVRIYVVGRTMGETVSGE